MARIRKRPDWGIVARSYWLKPEQKELPKEVMDEAFKMNQLWNKFVEVGAENVKIYQDELGKDNLVAGFNAEIESISKEIISIIDEVKKLRVKLRSKRGGDIELLITKKSELVSKRKELYKELKVAKAAAKVSRAEALKKIHENMKEKLLSIWKNAYTNEMHWGNANAVFDSYTKAWQNGLKTGNFPTFHPFTGEARFCFQFIGGIKTENIFGSKSKIISIDNYDRSAYSRKLKKSEKKKLYRTRLTCQIGGIPVRFIINIHRPIPDGYLKRAVIKRTNTGTNVEWSISFAIEMEPQEVVLTGNTKEAAIDVGFRMLNDSLRLGVLVADDNQEEIFVPDKIIKAYNYSVEVQKRRDLLMEKIKQDVLEMMPSDMPSELKGNWDKARYGRLMKILRYLTSQKHFLAQDLAKWRRLDQKLYNEMAGLRARAVRTRRWFYYNIANRLVSTYSTIYLERLNWGKMVTKKEDKARDYAMDASQKYRMLAAPGEFVEQLKKVAEKRHTLIEEREAAYTTMTCNVCGGICQPDNRAKLFWTCEHCGAEWDQDHNAAINLLHNSVMSPMGANV